MRESSTHQPRSAFILIEKISNYLLILFFTFLFLSKQALAIYKNDAENIMLILFNNVTYMYIITLFGLLFFLRKKTKLLFSLLLIFYSDLFIELKYVIQPFMWNIVSRSLLKQVFIFGVLFCIAILVIFLIKKYFKYVVTIIIVKYVISIFFLFCTSTTAYEPISSDINYKSEKNLYILLFDEYPSQYVINTYLHHKEAFLDSITRVEKLKHIKDSKSNYTNTEMSISSVLFGKTSSHFKVHDAINAFDKNIFTRDNKFVGYSFFDSINSRDAMNNSNFIHSISCLSSKYLFPGLIRILDRKGHGVFFNIDDYHKKAFELLDKNSHYRKVKKQVLFIHFFTPHANVFSNKTNVVDRIDEANEFIGRAVALINKNDPKASVVIMSDHGYRGDEVPDPFRYNNLLLYRNIVLDTVAIKKHGIVCLFNKGYGEKKK